MPRFGPVRRADLIHYLGQLGFTGPKSGGKHQHMKRGAVRVTIPNPHRGDISMGLLAKILRDASITREDWEKP